MNVLREPVEVGKLRYQQARRGLIRGWLYLSVAPLMILLVKVWFISRRIPVSAGSMFGAVVGLLLVTAVICCCQMLGARYRLAVWKWDDQQLRVHGVSYRWNVFEHFRVQPDSPATGFTELRVQFPIRRLQKRATSLAITSQTREIDALVKTIRQHVAQQM